MDNKDDKNVVASIFGGAAQEGGNAAGDGTAGAVKQEPNTQTQAQTQAQQTEPAQKPAEKLYAGKFKTPEELERAYEEAQRWGTQRSQEAAALKRELEELRKTAAPDMTKKQQEEFDAYVKKAINAAVVDEDPSLLLQLIDQLAEHKTDQKIRQIMPIIEPIAQKNAFQTQVDEFFREHPEALELAGEMTAIVQQDPAIMLDNKGNVRPDWPYRVLGSCLTAPAVPSPAAYLKKLDSNVGLRGIAKKILLFVPVGVGYWLDTLLGAELLRSLAIFFYIANEGLSILENLGRMDIPIPAVIKTALEQLRKKGEAQDGGG